MRKSLLPMVTALLFLCNLPAEGQPDPQPSFQRNDFAVRLYQALGADQRTNLFCSPYAVSAPLLTLEKGAAGKTAEELRRVLALPASGSSNVASSTPPNLSDFAVTSAVWADRKVRLEPPFLNVLAESDLQQADFSSAPEAARRQINRYIHEHTGSMIPELLPSGVIDSLTRLVVTSAVYFHKNWSRQFDSKLTFPSPFNAPEGEKITAQFMKSKADYRYYEDDELQAVELPYEERQSAMVILLPKKDLKELEKSLTIEKIDTLTARLQSREIAVEIPKFKLNLAASLREPLERMGLIAAFGGDADFSGINGARDLYVSAFLHQAVIAVDEQGTEAAAASAAVLSLKAARLPQPVFRADRPFIFWIRERKTGLILFMGRLARP